MEITSKHHWHKNIALYLGQDRTWKIDGELKKFDWEKEEDFIEEIERLFSLTGVGPDELTSDKSLRDFYKTIYDIVIPTEYQTRFGNLSTCFCNMGHCSAPTGFKQFDVKTVGDLFSHMGIKRQHRDFGLYYEYPDSVFVWIEKQQLPEEFYNQSCYREKIKNTQSGTFYTICAGR